MVDGSRIPVVAPQALVFRPGEEVRGRHDPRTPLEVIALHFTPVPSVANTSWADRLRSVRLREAEFFREAGERLVAENSRGDAAGRQTAEALGLALLGAVWRLALSPEPNNDRVERVVRSVQREPERMWSLAVLARESGMGATRLNQAFHRLTGGSPMEWVIRCRLARASWLLRQTDLKLSQIAEACGYRDVYFFSRQFRRFMGQTPGRWRSE